MHVGGVAFGFKAAPWVGWVARHACAGPWVCRGSSQWAQLPMPQALGATLVGLLGCRRGQKVGLPTLLKLENLIVGHGGSVVVGPKGHDKKKCACWRRAGQLHTLFLFLKVVVESANVEVTTATI